MTRQILKLALCWWRSCHLRSGAGEDRGWSHHGVPAGLPLMRRVLSVGDADDCTWMRPTPPACACAKKVPSGSKWRRKKREVQLLFVRPQLLKPNRISAMLSTTYGPPPFPSPVDGQQQWGLLSLPARHAPGVCVCVSLCVSRHVF